ncbi:UDP-N-acetylmuramoyl-tripeptide--D-alanyl-D-alanine ligase [Actinotignum timonense]|uniref:UDP-N-acetylmuramoyl-tripeptide--D-alanyl-D-alanine ligase n=2 Tax=Actinotignum timonense TaxID=1870995 RepID=A0ABU5GAA0_9ACTO|nr:UDP-N-acetylmuramoyl-tripeptide--D-alanyl-D-alanine ligase [Actinotignum timonense]MDK6906586.1 UDP-N-acetylmuramoyl-tripeptide--D-alanyl-D-alanine ligase [Actinotignum timonense]MDK8782391.1 UDP-N-acetylmuramoyl-tripeptide--D-alanyl-D-alanine ligase [Actinotignum timonense]MDY5145587.1 UDP-N-acetylmuramoyl-tripeptide--D-alanyl-D-alanine ligase [Actinotignum timonense]MDY5156654.1 UDP-N-acetylmuramoyl-tripeptide--D-alanyl-D-alanine ligase [Actinotignum timonense]
MISMSSAEVIAAVGGTALAPLCDTEVTAAVIDTRAITPGALFAAVKGARVDANTLSGQARAAGASLILTEDGQAARAGGAEAERIIVVDDIPAALGRLARHNLELARHVNPDLRVIAVTGSVGKTTTKDLLAAICRERGDVVAPPGSLNNEIGLPLTVLRVGANTATLVAEMGADHIGNLAYLTSIAPPDIAVVLVVARAHLGEFGGIENVARAKAELVEGLREDGIAILNADDPRVAAMAGQVASGRVRTFGRVHPADVTASDITLGSDGRASFTLHMNDGAATVNLGLVGEHQVMNALAAATAAAAAGVSLPAIVAGLSSGPASAHRMDVFRRGSTLIIDDSYNANPDSMRAGIAALGQLGSGRKAAILGDMLELGAASREEHLALLPALEAAGVSLLIAVGPQMAALAEAARDAGITARAVGAWEEAEAELSDMLNEDGALLIKGSHGSGVWHIATRLKGE